MPSEPFNTFLGTLSSATLAGTEPIPCLSAGATKKTTPADIGTFLIAATATGQVLYNKTGVITSGSAFAWNDTTNTLNLGVFATPAVITAAAGAAVSTGSPITIQAGPGGATSGAGGLLTLKGGITNSGAGGGLTMTTGAAATVNQLGGAFTITCGAGFGTGHGGNFQCTGGLGGATAAGGSITFTSGAGGATSGAGGAINFTGGNATGGGNGADITFRSGGGVGGGNRCGNVIFIPDAGSVGVANGIISLNVAGGNFVAGTDVLGNFLNTQALGDQSASTDTTIGNRTIPNNISTYISNAGAQAAVTLTMPTTPIDGQIIEVLSVSTITALTFAAAGTISDTYAATLLAGQGVRYRYNATLTSWFRLV